MNQTQTGKKSPARPLRDLALWIVPAAAVCGAGVWSLLGGAEAASMASAALGAAVLALTLVLALCCRPRATSRRR